MATSCGTWRHKPSRRRAEVKPTSSPPARLLCMLAQQSSRALWWLLATFYLDRCLCLTYSSYCKGPPQWRNSLLWLLLLHQCPSSLPGPKDDILPQILWRAWLWVEPHQRWLQKDPPAPSSKGSYPGIEHSSWAMQRYLARTPTW